VLQAVSRGAKRGAPSFAHFAKGGMPQTPTYLVSVNHASPNAEGQGARLVALRMTSMVERVHPPRASGVSVSYQ
jgi:hypothetical protein